MGHLEVAKLLIQEDPEFEYLANDAGETPIYIAAEMQFHGCLVEMLNTCKKPTYDGPLGRNALHAAILSGFGYTKISKAVNMFFEYHTESSGGEFGTECTKSLLEKKMCLCEEIDDFGWTPLHYAVKTDNVKAARMILETKTSSAYILAGDDEEWTTTFHIAARRGNVEMMKLISKWCPDCWEMVNSKGQNVLHETVLSKWRRDDVIEHIQSSDQFDNLVHQKDKDGNTPLHLLAEYDCRIILEFIEERRMLNYFAFNKKNQTLFDVASYKVVGYSKLIRKGRRKLLSSRKFADRMIKEKSEARDYNIHNDEKRIEGMIEMGKTSIVVATLILTMTFAAGIAVPGGYHQEKGYPLLLGNATFKAFIITNTLSFLTSICSIALHIAMVREASYPWRNYETVKRLYYWQYNMLRLTYLGVVIAFLCGMYATLATSRPLAIANLSLGISIALLTLTRYRKALSA